MTTSKKDKSMINVNCKSLKKRWRKYCSFLDINVYYYTFGLQLNSCELIENPWQIIGSPKDVLLQLLTIIVLNHNLVLTLNECDRMRQKISIEKLS